MTQEKVARFHPKYPYFTIKITLTTLLFRAEH